MSDPSAALVRERIVESVYACRDHDAYWCRPSRGWRTVGNYAIAAGRAGYVSTEQAARVLDSLAAAGSVERREVDGVVEYRHR